MADKLKTVAEQDVGIADASPVRRSPAVFTKQELSAMNVATRLLDSAKTNLALIWRPLQEKYGLPDGITYDRTTGEVTVDDG